MPTDARGPEWPHRWSVWKPHGSAERLLLSAVSWTTAKQRENPWKARTELQWPWKSVVLIQPFCMVTEAVFLRVHQSNSKGVYLWSHDSEEWSKQRKLKLRTDNSGYLSTAGEKHLDCWPYTRYNVLFKGRSRKAKIDPSTMVLRLYGNSLHLCPTFLRI